jgi:hypothetical protein
MLTGFTQRLNLRICPLDAQIIPVLCLVLTPVLLLHSLQATDFSRITCTTVHYKGRAAWQRVVDLRNVFDGSGDGIAELGAFDFNVSIRVFS